MEPGSLTNLAVSDVYEPGSTFKLVTYSAALDAAGVEPTDMVDCQGGSMTMYGRTLHDDKADHFGAVTVQYALEHSSDVGAAKMALKMGPDTFYKYIKGFGFGDRSGIELPSETRGLLTPPRKWGSTSILSLAIGQEIGVTPDPAGNHGQHNRQWRRLHAAAYPAAVDRRDKGRCAAAARGIPSDKPASDKLTGGAHRVIKELTAAKMRSMMQGIVMEGTGKAAQLNGYSSGGKTGTAQKVDPATHTYSHTKLVASFAGFAPVSSPAISVAVVIDTPTVGSLYGAAVSAPVFQERGAAGAGVPWRAARPADEDDRSNCCAATSQEHAGRRSERALGDLNAMFDAINNLPADDPLRASSSAATDAARLVRLTGGELTMRPRDPQAAGIHSSRILACCRRRCWLHSSEWRDNSAMPDSTTGDCHVLRAPTVAPQVQPRATARWWWMRASACRCRRSAALTLRNVVETAAGLGLRVEPVGSGMAREQAPAAGTMVPLGTEVVVRFTR